MANLTKAICTAMLWLLILPALSEADSKAYKLYTILLGTGITCVGLIDNKKVLASKQLVLASTSRAKIAAKAPEPTDTYPLFDLQDALSQPTMPHYMLYAPSGSGKTTTIGWMAGICKANGSQVTVISPHLEGDEAYLQHADKTVLGNDKAYQAISDLFDEMERRKADMPWCEAKAKYTHLTYIIDEAVSLFADFKAMDKHMGGDVQFKWVKLVVESRKYKIRLILGTQSSRVGAVGLEGRGDVVECLTFMYLGVKAKSMLKKSPAFTNEQKAAVLANHQYFAVVEYAEDHYVLPIPSLQV